MYSYFFNPPEITPQGETSEERKASREAIDKARRESKEIWKRIGWEYYLIKAVESKAFGDTIDEVENTPFENVIKYFSLQNAMII